MLSALAVIVLFVTMNRFLFFLSLCFTVVALNAQPGRTLPYWVKEIPTSTKGSHFYYRVTMAEAPTYDKAYANAFAKAIMEAKWRLGASVSFSDDIKSLENSVTEGVNVNQESVNIPMNKVCDFWEEVHTMRGSFIRLYILWQIAEDGVQTPQFEDFNKCQ